MKRFKEELFSREFKIAVGHDLETGGYFLSIPVVNRLADYDEYYSISKQEFDSFKNDPEKAKTFADMARERKLDDLLIVPPGTDRGVPM